MFDVLRLPVRPHPTDPFIAVAEVPDGVCVDERTVLTDEDGNLYTLIEERHFMRLAETAPYSDRRFVPKGRKVLVLPPDTTTLLMVA